jgi:hypothetical protein
MWLGWIDEVMSMLTIYCSLFLRGLRVMLGNARPWK